MAVQPLLRRGEARKRKFFALLPERERRERKGRGVKREKIARHTCSYKWLGWDGLWVGCGIEHITMLINKMGEGNEKKGKEEEEEN